jgi:hypothetical protein
MESTALEEQVLALIVSFDDLGKIFSLFYEAQRARRPIATLPRLASRQRAAQMARDGDQGFDARDAQEIPQTPSDELLRQRNAIGSR